MCMADNSFGRRIPFAFLQDVKEKFLSTYGKDRVLNARTPYGLNEFSRVLAKQMVKVLLSGWIMGINKDMTSRNTFHPMQDLIG